MDTSARRTTVRPSRRSVILGSAAVTGTVLLPAAAHAAPHTGPDSADGDSAGRGRRDRHPWDRSRGPKRRLRDGNPASAGLDATLLEQIPRILQDGIDFDPARFSGATALVARKGRIAHRSARGYALRWKSDTELLPEGQWIPAAADTIYDLASISKIFTAVTVMQLVERGELGLEDTIASHFPDFAQNGKESLTVQQLLTHSSGLPAGINLFTDPLTDEEKIAAVMAVKPSNPPGTAYMYSDVGLIVLGLLVEHLTGQSLDEVVAERVTGPLGMTETMYNPSQELLPRIAATEATGERGLVHGVVHDENAAALGGVAGHAGVFSTADDLAIFAQMFLNGGSYGKARVLRPETVESMFTDHIAEITGPGGDRRGLGPELEAWFYHSGLTSPYSAGHTGFTGTCLVIDPLTDTFHIMLANSVHPTREWSTTSVTRREVSTCVARALGLDPSLTERGWAAGTEDDATAILSALVEIPEGSDEAARLTIDISHHLETTSDLLVVEASADGGETWVGLNGALEAQGGRVQEIVDGLVTGWGERGRWDGDFRIADGREPLTGEVELRLRVVTDEAIHGLGVHLSRLRVSADHKRLLDTRREPDALVAVGWQEIG